MNHSDDELQSGIEAGHKFEDSMDSIAYQRVFNALKKEPYHLPVNFADKVLSRVEHQRADLLKEHVWFGVGILTFIIAAFVAAWLTDFKISFSTFKIASGYRGLFVFGTAFVLLLHLLDKRLLSRTSPNRQITKSPNV